MCLFWLCAPKLCDVLWVLFVVFFKAMDKPRRSDTTRPTRLKARALPQQQVCNDSLETKAATKSAKDTKREAAGSEPGQRQGLAIPNTENGKRDAPARQKTQSTDSIPSKLGHVAGQIQHEERNRRRCRRGNLPLHPLSMEPKRGGRGSRQTKAARSGQYLPES